MSRKGQLTDVDRPLVEVVPIESLQPDPHNANRGTERGSYMLNDSLVQRGAGRSILATGDNVILAGNKTHEQAVQAGFTEVIKVHTNGTQLVAVVRDDLEHGDPEATRLAIEDNRIGQASLEFDPAVLLAMGKEDDTLFDGLWRPDEWEELLGELFEEDDEPSPLAQMDKADELQQKWQVKTGDLWEIGQHRLVCGDCTDAAVVARVMDGELAGAIVTDPPYGVEYDGGTKKRKALSGDKSPSLYYPFLIVARQHSNDHVALYLFYADSDAEVARAVTRAGFIVRNTLIWNKNQAQFGALSAQYKQKHEPFLYCHLKGKAPQWFGPKNEVTVWDIDRASTNELHPTQKPPELFKRAIKNSTRRNDIVLDGFIGSGTTLVACEQLNRRGRGIEIEPKYVSVTLQRLADMGLEPIRIESQ